MYILAWSSLLASVSVRQHHLEDALLKFGQFHEALHELIAWVEKTNSFLCNSQPGSDPENVRTFLDELQVNIAKIYS